MLLSNQEAESVSGNRISGFGAADDAEGTAKYVLRMAVRETAGQPSVVKSKLR